MVSAWGFISAYHSFYLELLHVLSNVRHFLYFPADNKKAEKTALLADFFANDPHFKCKNVFHQSCNNETILHVLCISVILFWIPPGLFF